ncbi:alpha/beta hydrolase [Pseudomonas aeruginosa]|uniref:alpha/beta hydrolase n=1 Tax=Pseudomonas aeruginosa TaxID=287 RepID=UPI002B486F2F|nr:alpha/beta hydrolase [Pseudomonas aeruginosa]MEB3081547.1 alpha/beta hydrolase [Pseudomonas aeruginosa]MEB3143003.1 alpha/beta hydrolase [Pseudomonas aeruginosa]
MSILKSSLISAAMLFSLPSLAHAATVAEGANVVGSQKIAFNNGAIAMAGNLYLPPDYDSSRTYPAIVVAHPWGGVKEQTSGLYAQQLARKGFVTLAFDASHYGESGGEPRDLEDPADRVQDIRSAVGYLASLPQVDAARIGTLGVCAGGGYTLHEAQTDPRVKAVAGVVAYDIGDATRTGIDGSPVSAEDRLNLLQSVAEQLNKEAAGAPLLVQQLLPSRDQLDASTPNFVREATDYYLTPRGAHPNARNRFVVTSPGLHMAYYPLEHMELVAPRPVLLIAGERAETLKFSQAAYAKAQQPKELLVIPGASHFDLYDKPEYVTPAVDKLAEFFGEHL